MGWGEYGEMVFVWGGVSMVRWCLGWGEIVCIEFVCM